MTSQLRGSGQISVASFRSGPALNGVPHLADFFNNFLCLLVVATPRLSNHYLQVSDKPKNQISANN